MEGLLRWWTFLTRTVVVAWMLMALYRVLGPVTGLITIATMLLILKSVEVWMDATVRAAKKIKMDKEFEEKKTAMTNEFTPDWVSAPSETVVDILQSKKMSDIEFGQAMGWNEITVRRFLHNELVITESVAAGLAQTLGAPAAFWLEREKIYVADAARLNIAVRTQAIEWNPLPSEGIITDPKMFDVSIYEDRFGNHRIVVEGNGKKLTKTVFVKLFDRRPLSDEVTMYHVAALIEDLGS